MTLHRFMVESSLVQDQSGVLDEQQSRQAVSVLRLREGDPLVLFDGSGAEASAVIAHIDKRAVTYRVHDVSRPDREPELDLTVGLALLKGDRYELALQKLTEIGVSAVVPIRAERCVVSYRDARDWEKRAVRYRKIIVEALEQSERVRDLRLDEPVHLEEFLSRQPTIALVERGRRIPISMIEPGDQLAIAIGPEGGWSAHELRLIEQHAQMASLGSLILRAETAAIVAAGTLVQNVHRTSHLKTQQGDIQRGS